MKIAVNFFMILFILFSFNFASACSYSGQITFAGSYWGATFAFLGTVAKIEDLKDSYRKNIFVRVERKELVFSSVGKKLEGYTRKEDGLIVVKTGQGQGDCGVDFKVGQEYIIFASASSDGELFTDIVMGTMQLRDPLLKEKYIQELKKIQQAPFLLAPDNFSVGGGNFSR